MKEKKMLQHATKGGDMSFLNISIRLQQELEKSFNQEACKVLLFLAEEIYNANTNKAQKIFDDNREVLVLNIVERMREVFVTREEFDAKIGQLRSEIQAEFAKIRQEMAEVKAELKQDIAEVKAELKQDIAEIRQELTNTRRDLEKEISSARSELKAEIAELKTKGMYWLIITGIVVTATIIGANYAMMTFFLEHLSK